MLVLDEIRRSDREGKVVQLFQPHGENKAK